MAKEVPPSYQISAAIQSRAQTIKFTSSPQLVPVNHNAWPVPSLSGSAADPSNSTHTALVLEQYSPTRSFVLS